MRKLVLALAALVGLGAQAQAQLPSSRYAEGQVWEYRVRPGDEGSLLKIQRIEPYPSAPAGDGRLVYHLLLIGVRLGPQRAPTELQHIPVSQATLDAISRDRMRAFATWRQANGGVFTISVAEIAAVVEQTIRQPPEG